ncbi:MAG: hypothetical protein E6I58_01560 [Chloroflexi bacterium]|nr:MAG: hypothetical protein E6I58_01560 [Chloroflexota bacterium]
MRPSNQPLSEVTIKVPAPFAGISDLGFTAQYRSQAFQEPLRDVPLLIEGPPPPMRRLAELLQLLRGIDGSAYSWTEPVMLSDEVVVLAFRDRSIAGNDLSDGTPAHASYILNLVRPVVFTFLRDCAETARLRLADKIEMRVSAKNASVADIVLPRDDIVRSNGDRLLWGLAG